MRFKIKPAVNKREWHKWFAWYPVKVDGQLIWLERVYRKSANLRYGPDWEYRIEGSL